jgi:hypothetical protein
MDIEQTKKMNFMIRELTRTGSCKNFDDALAMAGNIYEGGMPDSHTSLVVTEESERVRELVDQRIRHHLSSLDSLKEAANKNADFRENVSGELKRLWAAIDLLKQEAPKPQQRPAEIESTAAVEQPQPVEQKVQLRLPQEEKQAPAPHPKAGNYNSNDVSLDKFFYFGTGPKK